MALASVDSIKASNPELDYRGNSASSSSSSHVPETSPISSASAGGPAAPPAARRRHAARASEPSSGSMEGAAIAPPPHLEGCTLEGSGVNWSVFYGNVLTAGTRIGMERSTHAIDAIAWTSASTGGCIRAPALVLLLKLGKEL